MKEEWQVKSFGALTTTELYNIMKARIDVFVVEQTCAYEEADGKDRKAFHLYLEQEEQIVSYARLLPAGISYPEPSIGRVLVNKEYRRRGYAASLLKKAIDIILNEWNEQAIKISAQSHLEKFYESLGFRTISEPYLEDGIPHIEMLLQAR